MIGLTPLKTEIPLQLELKERRRRQRGKVYQYADYEEFKDNRYILLKTFKYEYDCIKQPKKPRNVKLIPLRRLFGTDLSLLYLLPCCSVQLQVTDFHGQLTTLEKKIHFLILIFNLACV